MITCGVPTLTDELNDKVLSWMVSTGIGFSLHPAHQMRPRWLLSSWENDGLYRWGPAVRGGTWATENFRASKDILLYFFCHPGGTAISFLQFSSISLCFYPPAYWKNCRSDMLIFHSSQWLIYSLWIDLLERWWFDANETICYCSIYKIAWNFVIKLILWN